MVTLIRNLIFWGFIIFLITIFRRKRKTRQYTTSDEYRPKQYTTSDENRPNEDMGKFRTVVDEETITLEDNTYNVFIGFPNGFSHIFIDFHCYMGPWGSPGRGGARKKL